jgi:hypothetical protein
LNFICCNYNYSLYNFTSHKPETCLLSPVSLQTSYLFCLPVSLLNFSLFYFLCICFSFLIVLTDYWAAVRVTVTLRLVVYVQSVRLGAEPLETHDQILFSQLNICGHSPYITSSLTRGYVCRLQLLLDLASAFILGSESRGTRYHILLSQIQYFPFCRPLVCNQSQSYVTTDGQSASLCWNIAPMWCLRPGFYYCQTVACLLLWGALSNERTGLSFTIAASLASAVILGSESRGTRDHILLSHIQDFLFVASYDSQSYGGSIRPRLH